MEQAKKKVRKLFKQRKKKSTTGGKQEQKKFEESEAEDILTTERSPSEKFEASEAEDILTIERSPSEKTEPIKEDSTTCGQEEDKLISTYMKIIKPPEEEELLTPELRLLSASEGTSVYRIRKYFDPQKKVQRRINGEGCDLTKAKKAICVITDESNEPKCQGCAVRASIINNDGKKIEGYFVVTLNTAALTSNLRARRYGGKACIFKSDISKWTDICLNDKLKTEIGDFVFFKVDYDNERFLDVSKTTDKICQLTSYFVHKGKLHKLHFDLKKKKGRFEARTKELKKLQKAKQIQRYGAGAPVVTHNDQVVGLLSKSCRYLSFST